MSTTGNTMTEATTKPNALRVLTEKLRAEEAVLRDFPGIQPSRAFCLMLLALCERALDAGIHTMISNYEPPTLRLYQIAGARIQVLGKADKYGKRPVCAGAFEVSREVLRDMRHKLGMPCSMFLPTHENWLVDGTMADPIATTTQKAPKGMDLAVQAFD